MIFVSTNPEDIAAFVYLLESAKSNYVRKTFKRHITTPSKNTITTVWRQEKKITLNLLRCCVLRSQYKKKKKKTISNLITENPSISQIVYNYKYFSNSNNIWLRLLFHNAGTKLYQKFVKQVISLLTPEFDQTTRDELVKLSRSAVATVLDYYKFISGNPSLEAQQTKYFRFLRLPRPKNLVQPIYDTDLLTKQPLYQGFFFICCYNKNGARFFNRSGELQKGFLYNVKFTSNIVIECIVLPTDSKGFLRSWRYWPFKKNFKIVVTDVFKIGSQCLVNKVFKVREAFIPLVVGENVLSQKLSLKQILDYEQHIDLFRPIVGIMYKNKLGLYKEQNFEYRFPLNNYYDYFKDELNQFEGPVSLQQKTLNLSLFTSCEMSQYRSLHCIYGEDNQFYYSCIYSHNLMHFTHAARIKKTKR